MIPILMLTHNRLHLTKQAIASVLRNTFEPFSLTVFDNASEDGTQDWLESELAEDANVELYFSRENIGIHGGMDWFHARHYGAAFFAKLDNDTVVPEGWLGTLADTLEDQDVDLVGSLHHTFVRSALAAMERTEAVGFELFISPGGSGVVYRSRFVQGYSISSVATKLMDGWTNHCHRMAQLGCKAGFCGSVRIELLDMTDHFTRRRRWRSN